MQLLKIETIAHGCVNMAHICPILGSSCCHQTYLILFDGLDWAKHVKKRLL